MNLEKSFRPVPDGFEKAMNRAFIQIRQEQRAGKTAKRLSFAMVMAITLLVAAMAVAAAVWGGVLHFSDDWMQDHESITLPQAQGLVQTDLAHYQFGSVKMDVLQAIYDGQELRIVYSLEDSAVINAYPDNPWQTLEEMNLKGFLGSCDGGAIDGKDIYWENDRMIGTQVPGRVLFYKRANLEETLEGKFTVSLYVLAGGAEQPSFVMDAGMAAAAAKRGTAKAYEKDGLKVELISAVFTPLRGSLEVRFTSADNPHDWSLYLPDGTLLSGYMVSWDPEETVQDILFLFDPPQAGWPETLFFKASESEKMEVEIQ